MKDCRKNPLIIYIASLAALALVIGVVFVIVEVNSRLAPEKQTLTETSGYQNLGGILSVTAWEYDRSGTVTEIYGRKDHYKPITMSIGNEFLIVSAYNKENSVVDPDPRLYISAYCDNAKLTARYSLPISYWGKPCTVKDFVSDKMNYAGEKPDISRRDSLMIYAAVDTRSDESFMNSQTDESGKLLYHAAYSERLLEVFPHVSGNDSAAMRDISETTLIFEAFSNDLDEKLIAYAKVRIRYYSKWNFEGVTDSNAYRKKLASLGIEDDLDSYGFATAELVEYWQAEQ